MSEAHTSDYRANKAERSRDVQRLLRVAGLAVSLLVSASTALVATRTNPLEVAEQIFDCAQGGPQDSFVVE